MKNTPDKMNKANPQINTASEKEKKIKYLNWGSLIVFVIAALYYLPIHNKNVLYEIQNLSIFLPNQVFFAGNMKLAGGLLSYLGAFFTQFYYYPWLGSLIFISLLLLLQYLIIKVFNLPVKFYALTFIPSYALLVSLTQMGYLIFSFKSQGYFYANLLGTILVLLSLWGYKLLSSWIARSVIFALYVSVLYPFLGFYALFAALLFGVYEWGLFRKDKDSKRIVPIAIGVLFIAVIPFLYWIYYYTQLEFGLIYMAGLPLFTFDKEQLSLWIPFLALFVSLLLFTIFSLRELEKETKSSTLIAVTGLYLISLFGLCHYSFEDDNFQTSIAMNQAIFDNKWNEVFTLSEKLKGEPSRFIVMSTNLALQKLHIAGDKMFTYKNGDQDMKSPYSTRLMLLGGKPMYFQNGKIYYCYRWCMEDMVEYGMKVEYLKYMVKCSLMNREFALATKYIDVLKSTLFHKDWALRYEKYVDHPELITNDPEFKAIQPLTAYNDLLDGDGGVLEGYLLNSFAYMQGGPPDLVELSLQCSLIMRRIDLFWPKFFLYARTHKRLPVHYQEAALLFSYLEQKVDVRGLNFDPQVVESFNQLVQMSKHFSNNTEEENKPIFEPLFGKTYWFYYFFEKGLKTS